MVQKMMTANLAVDEEESIIVHTMMIMVIQKQLSCDYPRTYANVNDVRGLGRNMMVANLAVDKEESNIVHTMRKMVTQNSSCANTQGIMLL